MLSRGGGKKKPKESRRKEEERGAQDGLGSFVFHVCILDELRLFSQNRQNPIETFTDLVSLLIEKWYMKRTACIFC